MLSKSRSATHGKTSHKQIQSVYYELSAEEIYATYARDWEPEDVLHMDHTEIASRLRLDQGSNQDAAAYAADQILLVAERFVSDQK